MARPRKIKENIETVEVKEAKKPVVSKPTVSKTIRKQNNTTPETSKPSKSNYLILLTADSKIDLKARSGTLKAIDYKTGKFIDLKFNKNKLYKLLDGRLLIKNIYKQNRLLAIEVDSKGNSSIMEGKKLKDFEKLNKIDGIHWSLKFKDSFGA